MTYTEINEDTRMRIKMEIENIANDYEPIEKERETSRMSSFDEEATFDIEVEDKYYTITLFLWGTIYDYEGEYEKNCCYQLKSICDDDNEYILDEGVRGLVTSH